MGELPETERSELANRYFLDEELFDELLDVENEAQTAQQSEAAQRERIQQLEQELSQTKHPQEQQTKTRGDVLVLAALVLTPALRSGGTPDSLTLSPATMTVGLIIPIARDEQITDYRAVLQTTGGQLILDEDHLHPQRTLHGSTITLHLPAVRLKVGTFKLTMRGKAVDDMDIAQDYYFSIARN